jgi:hypothetical protein
MRGYLSFADASHGRRVWAPWLRRKASHFLVSRTGEIALAGPTPTDSWAPRGGHVCWPAPSGLGPSGLGPSGLGPSGLGPSGLGPSGLGPSGLGPSGLGPSGLGPSGLGPSGLGPSGPGHQASGHQASGPQTSGPHAPAARACACARVPLCACARVRLCACARVPLCACASVRVCACARVRVCACAPVLALPCLDAPVPLMRPRSRSSDGPACPFLGWARVPVPLMGPRARSSDAPALPCSPAVVSPMRPRYRASASLLPCLRICEPPPSRTSNGCTLRPLPRAPALPHPARFSCARTEGRGRRIGKRRWAPRAFDASEASTIAPIAVVSRETAASPASMPGCCACAGRKQTVPYWPEWWMRTRPRRRAGCNHVSLEPTRSARPKAESRVPFHVKHLASSVVDASAKAPAGSRPFGARQPRESMRALARIVAPWPGGWVAAKDGPVSTGCRQSLLPRRCVGRRQSQPSLACSREDHRASGSSRG